ncbi:hypothetical protein D9M68_563350 [compost metagenome]
MALSAVTVTVLPLTLAPVTLWPMKNSMPNVFFNTRCNSLPRPPSIVPIIEGIYSITDTFVPSLAYTEPSSKPITPPPITTMVFGTSLIFKASVEVIMRFLSIGKNGKAVGLEPVAIITFLAVRVSVVPSLFVTNTVFLSTKEPKPSKASILFFLNKYVIPAVF